MAHARIDQCRARPAHECHHRRSDRSARNLGPGLLESIYEACLAWELRDRGVGIEQQVAVPVVYKGHELRIAYRVDLVVERAVIVDRKSRGIRSARWLRVPPSRAFIGISGYDYKPWRGQFYPDDVPARRWLEYASGKFNSIELNGTFYSLKSPAVFERWVAATPSRDFIFAVKGGRFITHNLKLRNAEASLGNFFASGVLALGRKTGPFLWQLPATYRFDAERMDSFMRLLPRSSREAEDVARRHDHRLRRGALVDAAAAVKYRHAFEVRHPSYFHEEFYAILREHGMAFVVADTAGKFPYAEEVTTDFVYVRLHGSRQLYASGYTDEELDEWTRKIARWRSEARSVYVYFDNDAKVHAPFDAMRLAERVGVNAVPSAS